MKILFVVDSFSGGAGNVVQILGSEFSKNNDVNILLLNGKQSKEKYDLSKVKITSIVLSEVVKGKNKVFNIHNYVKAIKNEFNKINPEVIVSFLTENNILCCMANKNKISLIISERSDPFVEKHKKHWSLLRLLEYPKASKIVVQCSNFINFCNSRFVKSSIVIANPIMKPAINHEVREKRDIVLASVGRLRIEKNFSWMLDRMAEIHKLNDKIKLKIYGEGPLEEELRKKISTLNLDNCVELCGYTDSPHQVLTQSDIYLMTSDYEGFPNALSEAMAVGLPSVSRMCHEGIKDLVQNGTNGYLVEPKDTRSFVERVIMLSQDSEKRKQISKEAKKVSDTYSVSNIVTVWDRLIQESMRGE